jgi:hypothetical protein
MDAKDLVAAYAIVVGILILDLWAVLYVRKAIPELRTAKREIVTHIAAEMTTAIVLLAGGALNFLSAGSTWILLVGMGMLLYSVVNSSGYYWHRKVYAPLTMFAVLGILAVVSIAVLVV